MPEVRIVSTAADLNALKQPWRDALSRASSDAPTASPAWLRPACDDALREQALRVITVSDAGELVGVLPMHLAPQGRGPLRRNLMRPLSAGPGAARRRGNMLVVSGHEQQVIRALVELLDGELRGWDRLELTGMVTDGALPSLWLANAGGLGVAELSMDGHELRRDLGAELPARPAGWEQGAEHELRRAEDAAGASPLLDMLDAGLRAAALAALGQGASLWGLYSRERLVGAALTLAGNSAHYALCAAVRAAAPAGAEEALHGMLMERARDAGASQYAAWCAVPSALFNDQCAIRGLTVERHNSLNTRNRLWNRLQASVPGLSRR